MLFKDRREAAKKLASALKARLEGNAVVYALPRGGVVLGAVIAKGLGAPLDLLIVRKVGHPSSAEYAIAAVAEDGHLVSNEGEVAAVDSEWFKYEVASQRAEAARRREVYCANRKPIEGAGKIAIVVDDGLATGLTMRLAIEEIKHRKPKKIFVAVPVASEETVRDIKPLVDDVIALHVPRGFFGAIGAYYADFPQISDAEVIQNLKSCADA